MCVRDGETVGPLGNTLEVTERVGASAGAHACGGAEGARMPQSNAGVETKQGY